MERRGLVDFSWVSSFLFVFECMVFVGFFAIARFSSVFFVKLFFLQGFLGFSFYQGFLGFTFLYVRVFLVYSRAFLVFSKVKSDTAYCSQIGFRSFVSQGCLP